MTKDMLARAVRKFKRGDKSAFDYIYDNTYKVVYLVVFSILRSKERAEDVTQDAYVKAVQHLDEYEDDTHFVARGSPPLQSALPSTPTIGQSVTCSRTLQMTGISTASAICPMKTALDCLGRQDSSLMTQTIKS